MACPINQPHPDAREQLEALVKHLNEDAEQTPSHRTLSRRSIYAPVTLGVIAGGYKPLHQCWGTDLSADGLGMLCEHELPVGSLMCVDLGSVTGSELLVQVRICYVNRLLKHTYRIGATFTFVESDPQATRQSA